MTAYTTPVVSPSPSPDRLLFTLENGLHVAIQEDHFAPVVAIQIWVKAGSADETLEVAGAAHVHEHMIFKGTERRPVGAIAAEIESSGGQINAFTTNDHTVYHVVLASRHFSTGLDILADAIQHTAFDPDELGKELQVVMEEWRRGEDSPTTRAATELFRLAYTTHPYGRPVIGYRETIEALNRERVLHFYRQWYRPNNMTVVIVGDIDRETAQREVTRLFADTPTVPLPARPRMPEPPQTGLRFSVVDMNIEEFYLYCGFHVPPVEHPDIFALDLLSYILGGGESARLIQTLQADKELVNWISAHAYTPADAGLFIVAAALEHDKIQPALHDTLTALFACKHTPPSEAELARARANLQSDFIYRRETVQGQARQLGYFLTVFSDPDYERRYLEGLAEVTTADLQRVAQRYFNLDNLSVVLLGATAGVTLPTAADIHTLVQGLDAPPAKAITTPAARVKGNGHVSSIELKNGVRLLVKEHHSVPVMSIQAVMLGGLLFENEATSGINNFIAGLLTRGSERFSRLAFAEAVESLAASVYGFSGRNSLGLSGSFLTTGGVEPAFDLFLETLLRSTFPVDEIEKRRRELLLALKNREDDLAQTAFDLFYETLFTTHPYRFSILGNEQSIQAIQQDDLIAGYRSLQNPQRLVVSVVGDVETDRVVACLQAALEHLPAVAAPNFPPLEPRPAAPRRQSKAVDKQQAHVILGFQGVSLDRPERYPLKVLEALLSRQGGRLFYELREQHALAYSVHAFNVEGVAPGACGIYLGTDPSKVDEALTAARKELARVREELVSTTELEQAQKYLTGSYEIVLQSNGAQSEQMAFNELYGLGYNHGATYLAAINNVTTADLRHVAQTYFAEEASTEIVIGR